MAYRNICVYGAGALGGSFAASLKTGLGEDANVAIIARGAHLDAIRKNGITVRQTDGDTVTTVPVTATDNPADLPKQDLIITGLKAHQLSAAAEGIAGLLHEKTRVVMILNGIPWWYFHRDRASGRAEMQLPELDPDGLLWRLIGPERVIGCVAYQGAEIVEPGTIQLTGKGFFYLGEPSGQESDDLHHILDLTRHSGLDTRDTSRIRDEIWRKLLGNAAINPISALTRALASDIMKDKLLHTVVANVMNEAMAVGQALGAKFDKTVEDRLAQNASPPPVRSSMLQDLLAGKDMEIVPLVGVIITLGRIVNVPTPTIETVFALVSRLNLENQRS